MSESDNLLGDMIIQDVLVIKPLKKPNIDELKAMVEEFVKNTIEGASDDQRQDDEEAIAEQAIIAFFGPDIWEKLSEYIV